MNTPYLEIDLSKLHSNAKQLTAMFGSRGIDITGVTKSVLGDPEIAAALVSAGITSLGDSRIENIIRMKEAGVQAAFTLIRTPALSAACDVVTYVDVSFNTELSVIAELSEFAVRQKKVHDIVLMVEMGDLREGILREDINKIIGEALLMKGIRIIGLGTNLACFNGVKPTRRNMDDLSRLTESCERNHGIKLHLISGGNSANFDWAFADDSKGRINNVRLGEAIFLGRETLSRRHIKGLHLDAVSLIGEIIESKVKPSLPEGETGQDAFGNTPVFEDKGEMLRSIVALGKQDVCVSGLTPMIDVDILGSSSDHIVLDATRTPLKVGDQVRFSLDYAALLSSMTSPFVRSVYI
ncbi:alanine/ornithine racemase family PLP-dependent enzyme [Maridesulfovibrio hydrothermalis]|uniref:Putative amino acid racemase n=1 Tax=Maridesulfovibrio hydrothermalis AM13 = DSM 14728 TaxID=1121451 RepID=L0RB63_9BACT|nr:alanine/ornithine racemase family PLP-dependent enzyme [Maridesulfovibrio hydrothermalis]CCO23410.1 putative amino acid racemase [Maridesulfovibrio hydrothermalis AM13 = DSM 14728]